MPQDNRSLWWEQLRDMLNLGPQIQPNQLPPKPASLLPDPLVVGQDLAKDVHKLTTIAPEIRRKVKLVSTAAPESVIRLHAEQGFPLQNMDRSTILGFADKPNNRVYINPSISNPNINLEDNERQLPTLAHEFGHMMGLKHGLEEMELEDAASELEK